jgi:quercetin dioxygenase-like cupin family protein
MQNIRAEIVMPTAALQGDIPFFTETLGMRMEEIFPADDPREAVFAGHGCRVRLRRADGAAPGLLRILADDPVLIAGGARELTAPGGARVEIAPLAPPVETPVPERQFVVRKLAEQAPWVVGRAGMEYRDLIPGRLGGSIIASHIRIPQGGPVPDMVHYHSVGFQLIFCIRGWVDLVYEDQGEPFRLTAGNCVIQPPEIRHRVLHSGDNLEVIEIGVPAEHVTTIDHEMTLPTGRVDPDRRWDGQRFVHFRADEVDWDAFRVPGFEARETGIAEHTGGVAGVQVVRRASGDVPAVRHDAGILFGFVMAGGMTLEGEGQEAQALAPGDAFVIPPGLSSRFAQPTGELQWLEVALPGRFATEEV